MYPVQKNSSVKVTVPCILHGRSPPTQSLGLICQAKPAGSSEIDYLEQYKQNIHSSIARAFLMMLMRMYMSINIMQSEQRFLICTNLCQLLTPQNRNLPVTSPASVSVRQVMPENRP